MQIELILNSEKPIGEIIKENLKTATEVRIAVAFLKQSGIDYIKDELEEFINRDGKLEIIVGLDFGTTDPKAIRYFLDLSKQKPAVNIYVYHILETNKGATYHPKLYLFRNKENFVSIAGSSNLTKGGLSTNVEINTCVTETNKPAHYNKAVAIFNSLKNGDACVLATEAITKVYESVKISQTPKISDEDQAKTNTALKELSSLLQKPKRQPNAKRVTAANDEKLGWLELIMFYIIKHNIENFELWELSNTLGEFAKKRPQYFSCGKGQDPSGSCYAMVCNKNSKEAKSKNNGRDYFERIDGVGEYQWYTLTPNGQTKKSEYIQILNSQVPAYYEDL